jgi:protein phosphatase
MAARIRLISGSALDIGRNPKRPINEDRLGVFEPVGPDCPDHLYLVCDGIGGHLHGELASGIAVDEIPRAYREARPTASVEQALREAVGRAHQEIRQRGQDLSLGGSMGTTVVAAVVAGQELVVANVGDSRAYHIRAGRIRQISKDHSRAVELRATDPEGAAAPADALGRHVLTRSLSAGRDHVEPDLFKDRFRAGDALILCSDGLWGCVPDTSLLHVVGQLEPEAAAAKLVQMANRAGGPDNISVIVVRRDASAGAQVEEDTGEMRAITSQQA